MKKIFGLITLITTFLFVGCNGDSDNDAIFQLNELSGTWAVVEIIDDSEGLHDKYYDGVLCLFCIEDGELSEMRIDASDAPSIENGCLSGASMEDYSLRTKYLLTANDNNHINFSGGNWLVTKQGIYVTFTAGRKSIILEKVVEIKPIYISQDIVTLSYAKGATATIDIKANCRWIATCDSPTWINLPSKQGSGNGYLVIEARQENPYPNSRIAKLTIHTYEGKVGGVIDIVQEGCPAK